MKIKVDRRTLYTISVIKEAFLELINKKPYIKISVTELCKAAEITRSTFYLHYTNLSEVLNEVIDDALSLSIVNSDINFENKNISFEDLNENESLVPACQRIGNNKKYQKLLLDPDLSEYIIGRIMVKERKHVLPLIIKKTGLSKEDAETLFSYVIHGSFAVNRLHNFVKDEKWAHDVQFLNKFTQGGYNFLKNNKK